MENKPKAAIVYLCSVPKYVPDLKLSLSCLDRNFNDQFKYPVVVFHRELSREITQDIRKSTNSIVTFQQIEWEIPDFLDKKEIPEVYSGTDVAYRHMCRFLGGPIYWQQVLNDYKWYWRLDTDSFLLKKIDYDVFSLMENKDYSYGYMIMLQDREEVVRGLWDAVKRYIRENNIQPTFLNRFIKNRVWDKTLYYTNFEIGKLDFWRSEQFKKYFDYLDRLGGIYKYRWGDTAYRSLFIYMFLEESKVHQFDDIAYKHQSVVYIPPQSRLLRFLWKKIFFTRRKLWANPILRNTYAKLRRLPEWFLIFCKNTIKNTPLYFIFELKEAITWELKGKQGPPPHLIKQRTVKEYARRFSIDNFIETGTYMGRMVSATKNTFKEIFSIELDEKLFEKAKNKFSRYPHIHILKGDSGKVLPEILVSVKKPCLFWLDAHYSKGVTAKGDIETPIAEELAAIFHHPVQDHVILIDDARCFTGENDYPALIWLKDYALKHRPNWNFEVEDGIIRINPKNKI